MKILTKIVMFTLILINTTSVVLASERVSDRLTQDAFNTSTNFSPSDSSSFLSGLVSNILPITLTFGGFILVVMLVLGGYQMMTSVGNPQSQEAGKQRIVWSIVGFLILFSAFWIWQIVNTIFGIEEAPEGSSSTNPVSNQVG